MGIEDARQVGRFDDLLDLFVGQPAPGVVVVAASGEIDISTAPRLLNVVLDAVARAPDHLVVDMDSVTFFGSAAVNALLTIRERACEDGFTLYLTGALGNPRVARILQLTGLTTLFTTYPDLAAALAEITVA
jgi:anti-sigma B factor antagonist